MKFNGNAMVTNKKNGEKSVVDGRNWCMTRMSECSDCAKFSRHEKDEDKTGWNTDASRKLYASYFLPAFHEFRYKCR